MNVVNGPAHGIELADVHGMVGFFISDTRQNKAWRYERIGTSFFCAGAISPIPRYLRHLNDTDLAEQILAQIQNYMIDQFTKQYRFLSNFCPTRIVFDGQKYAHVEAAYQAAKCIEPKDKLIFQDPNIEPQRAKALGRKVAIREDWEAVKYSVMVAILKVKFADPQLAEKLKATGEAELVEGNHWHDNTWGICKCPRCPGAGKNLLGKALMEVRAAR